MVDDSNGMPCSCFEHLLLLLGREVPSSMEKKRMELVPSSGTIYHLEFLELNHPAQ